LTLFTTAKPFLGHAGVIQRNALGSWAELRPRPEVLLVGDEDGYEAAAADLGVTRISQLPRNEFGTPLISGLFRLAHQHGTGDVLCFSNADIILPPRFTAAIEVVAEACPRFLMVGRRVDLDITEPVDFGGNWWAALETRSSAEGHGRHDLAIDYFAFSRQLFASVPPFAIGRTRYDNWLLWKAAAEGAVVVDATAFVTVVHQNHDYGHIGGTIRAWEGPEAQRAEQLIGHWSHYHSIAHATWLLTPDGQLAPARGLRYAAARPRRIVAQSLRLTRPYRRRAKVAIASWRQRPGQPGPTGPAVSLPPMSQATAAPEPEGE
jgi:hypothetical protein